MDIETLARAAPDMLACLELVQETVPDHDYEVCQVNGFLPCNCDFGPMHVAIRAAIAKARG